jgi:hypothetical protein
MNWCTCSKAAHAVAATLLFGVAPAVLAQMRVDAVPASVLRPSSVMATAPALDTPAAVVPRASVLPSQQAEPMGMTSTLPVSYSTNVLGSTVQLDMPRYDSSGKYVRPKFYVGLQSDSMRNVMNSTGLAADKCMLPMVRARTRVSGDGEVTASLWVYARCTFF